MPQDFKDFYNYLDFLYPDFEVINSHEKAQIEVFMDNKKFDEAANLINNKSNKDQLLNFAASGFRDFSRIAASSPEVWRDISLAYKKAILNDLKLYQDEISSIIKLIEEENTNDLDQYLIKASTTRSEWIESQK